MKPISMYEPWLTNEDAVAVQRAVSDGWISGRSPNVTTLEQRFAAYLGATAGVAVSNGTAALELSLRALGVGPGDEVICPSLTIISCARAIVRVGARPVFVDVDEGTHGLDVEAALAHVTERTRALLAVHLHGIPVDLERLLPLRERGVAIVEDGAQAIGSEVELGNQWVRCGSVGDLATFSFYANKSLTTGEGGMIVGRSEAVVGRAREAGNMFFGKTQRYRHEELGSNARMNGMAAALGLSQLGRIDAILARKRLVEASYREALRDEARVRFPTVPAWAAPVPWMVAVVLDAEAESVAASLRTHGIESRPFFVGMHAQPALRALGLDLPRSLPVTERLSRHGLLLPSSPTLTEPEIHRVCGALRSALRS